MTKKKHVFEIQVNSISDTDNPTKKEVEFILHDFDISHNYAFIKKETAEKTLATLKDMPIVCQYFPVSEGGAKDDALGSHGMYLEEDRDTGEAIVSMDTLAIGVFNEPAQIRTELINGVEKEVVVGKGILWASRYPNIVGLLKEWSDKGIPIKSSMEILYDSYKVDDGVTEILNYCYEGHCLLNSENRGGRNAVSPAYDVSKLTKLVAEAIDQENEQKEDENMPEQELEKVEATEVVEQVSEEVVEETKEEVVEETVEEIPTAEETPAEPEEAKEDGELEKLQNEFSQLKVEHEKLQEQFNSATEKLTQLNGLVEELKPFKEQFETEKLEKAISEKKEFYSAKFEALNAKEKFESEEVQELILKSVNADESKQAILQLNSMLVDLVDVVVVKETPAIKEMASKRENLLPAEDSFESRYSL